MKALLNNLLNDEAGFIVSAELVLIATLVIIALIVGLSEVAFNVNHELQDVGRAFAAVNQSFSANGSSYNGNSHGMSPDIQSGGPMGEF